MFFVEIVNAVLANGFDESQRAAAKTWVVARHAWLWDAYDWTFKQATATVTFPASGQIVADAPADLAAVLALYNAAGAQVRPFADPRTFFDRYNTALGVGAGSPAAYTVFGGQLLVDTGDSSTGTLLYEKSKPALSADSDTTGLPDGYDLALVFGAKATGFKLTNVPLADALDADFTAAVNALQGANLVSVKQAGGQLGAYRPR